MRSFLLLVNERARGGDVVSRVERLLKTPPLDDTDVQTALFVDDDGICRGLSTLDATRTPVAVGGDGTVGSVARLLRAEGLSDRPMGVLPLGTGNGLAHSLGIASLSRAVATLQDGVPQPVDALMTTHPQAPVSMLNISVGLESLVTRDYQAWRHKSRWTAALAAGMRRGLWRVSGVAVDVDGQRIVQRQDKICNVGMHNMPCYGFGVTPQPSADPTDGQMDLRIHLSCASYWAYMASATIRRASPIVPRPDWPRIRQVKISTVLPVQADGESLSPATFEIEVVPAAMTILAPAL
ncbi:MAG: hypothetical protein HOM68_01375 [Gemmatimonadetes bacterium]|nr:hypothetical protein [Gemmatimonadota bacterium]MBT5055162.1 hypothetical protein [Gemmatimonadota bacterium]MBT5146568.1 hypothetical protein [Gemmatimonadota bacterium]MBT5591489.1 hypothetical protein [Gemmatimonadota bacterium]MBT5962056.1 hypothetical protein [Gemmatimonadota bacterium]